MPVNVKVEVAANERRSAKVEIVDTGPDGRATTHLACLVPSGHSAEFQAHSTRAILVTDIVPNDAPAAAGDAGTA